MKMILTSVFALALPTIAMALATETFGNAPAVRQPDWGDGVLEVVNLKSRVYSVWVNGNENFYFRGNADAINEALRAYAKVAGGAHEVILLPGAGMTRSFDGKQIDFDWQLHVPSGIYKAVLKKSDPVLTIYIRGAASDQGFDRKQVDKWLDELDHDKFAVREKATAELAKLGDNVRSILRDALKTGARTAEGKRRIEGLLDKLPGLAISDLEIPKGIKLIDTDDLVTRNLKEVKNTDPQQRGHAVQDLGRFADSSDKVVPALAEMLKTDKDAHVRRCAAAGLAALGAKSRPALAVLKEGRGDSDAYIRDACQRALDAIEKSKDASVSDDDCKRLQEIQKAIGQFKSEKKQ